MNPSAKMDLFVSLTMQLQIGLIITLFKAAKMQKIPEMLLRCYAIEEHREAVGLRIIIAKPQKLGKGLVWQ